MKGQQEEAMEICKKAKNRRYYFLETGDILQEVFSYYRWTATTESFVEQLRKLDDHPTVLYYIGNEI